jgi:hypothetical protein
MTCFTSRKVAMRDWVRSALSAALVWYGFAAMATPETVLDWAELPDPSAQIFEDPYRDLSLTQRDHMRDVVQLRIRLLQETASAEDRQIWQAHLATAEAALAAEGIDADWLLDQRENVTERRRQAGTYGNPQLDGQTITLAGFAIPAPHDPDGRSVLYLVPERGMCSHMPAPPPNQMIRVRLKDNWTPGYFHEPVRLTGVLTIDPSHQTIMVVDGFMPMNATFRLEADQVQTLQTQADGLEWQPLAADHIPTAGSHETDKAEVSQ